MKVWVVWYSLTWKDRVIEGVFGTQTKAWKCAKEKNASSKDLGVYEVEEWEVID